jgi:transposase InsO family protein
MTKQFNQQQKLTIIEKGEKFGIKQAAEVAKVHYTTVYAWKKQLESLGKEVFLEYEPPRPGRGTKEISTEDEQAILKVWKENRGYGPGQVRAALRRQGITISIGTTRKIMLANGYQVGTKKKDSKKYMRYEASRPLELAQMDILEVYINKLKIYIILLIDDYSRFILGFRALTETSIDSIIKLVDQAIQRYGQMGELLTDRGFVFYSWRGVNRFEKYLEMKGVDQIHSRPHHPQTLGKVEALNRRIQNELFRRQHFSSHSHAVAGLKEWVEHYNYKRPHQGIGGFLVPAERFHGQADKVLDKIATGVKIPEDDKNITRDILSVNVNPDGTITLNILGHSMIIQETQNDNHIK